MNRRLPVAAVAVTATLAGAGCVDRRIHITSEPSGAIVLLNNEEVGRTPVEVNFTYFGTYDVRLRKEGYEPLVTSAKAEAPLHEQPGFDFAAMLLPGWKTTRIDWHFELEPETTDIDALLERAGETRGMVHTVPSDNAEGEG